MLVDCERRVVTGEYEVEVPFPFELCLRFSQDGLDIPVAGHRCAHLWHARSSSGVEALVVLLDHWVSYVATAVNWFSEKRLVFVGLLDLLHWPSPFGHFRLHNLVLIELKPRMIVVLLVLVSFVTFLLKSANIFGKIIISQRNLVNNGRALFGNGIWFLLLLLCPSFRAFFRQRNINVRCTILLKLRPLFF